MALTPTRQTPVLDLPLTGGGSTDDLVLGTGADGRFTLLFFFRGLHCPVCREQLGEIERRLDDLRDAGAGRVAAVSMESAERSEQLVRECGLKRLAVAHGLDEQAARDWGLHISRPVQAGEPDVFSEPGVFVLDSDGSLFWSDVASMPFARPAVDDIIAGLQAALRDDYPARGGA